MESPGLITKFKIPVSPQMASRTHTRTHGVRVHARKLTELHVCTRMDAHARAHARMHVHTPAGARVDTLVNVSNSSEKDWVVARV